MLSFFSKRYDAILRLEYTLLNRARIAILVLLLSSFSILSVLLFILYFVQEHNILLYRISILMVLFISGLVMIFTNFPWKKVGHYFIFCLTCFIWSNLFLLKNGINIVTVQYVMMIVTGGFYILGAGWGLFYSLLNTVPLVLLFTLQQFYGVELPFAKQSINIYSYNFSIIINFLLLIVIHYFFFRAFKLTSQKEQQLTANLKNSLLSAQKIAEDKTNFLSTMSHELRTPLNAVIGITNVLLENDPKADQKENLDILHFSAENLMSTINDILSFNRLDAGMEKLELHPFRLDHLLTNVYGALKYRSSAKDIDFSLWIDERLKDIRLLGDKGRLTQILFNLGGNAIKFTAHGFVKIKIHLEEINDEVYTINFELSDSGIGIPKDQIEHIFEPYFRAAHGNNRQYHGTGLGLSIARRLVSLHGGVLSFHSQEGHGTTFNFQLKMVIVEMPKDQEDLNLKTATIDISHLRILVAEDNEINVMVLQKTLARWNLKADVAQDGQLALNAVENGNYDVVFMDINMPVMDGFEASRRIRQLDDAVKSQIYIIALTASIDISIEVHPESKYLDDFMLKPFYPDELRDKLVTVARREIN